ncbi:16226_t:CDS:2 [Gigaspora rosea]|nr:16226_t:CDS:2 [Gigaspora rosea]
MVLTNDLLLNSKSQTLRNEIPYVNKNLVGKLAKKFVIVDNARFHSTTKASNSGTNNNNNKAQETNENQFDFENNKSSEVFNSENNAEGDHVEDHKQYRIEEIEFEYQESANNLDDDKLAEIIVDLSYSNDPEASKVAQAIESYSNYQ